MKKQFSVLIFLPFFTVMACSQSPHYGPSSSKQSPLPSLFLNLPGTSLPQSTHLGRGLILSSLQTRGVCIQSRTGKSPELVGERSSHFRLTQSQEQKELLQEIEGHGSVSASDPVGFLSGSVEGEYISKVMRTNWTWSLDFTQELHLGQLKLEVNDTAPSSLGHYAMGRPLTDREDICGDAFVHQISLGADLRVSAVFHTRTSEDLSRLKTTITASAAWGLVSSTTTKTEEHHEFDDSTSLTIQFMQRGGDPALRSELQRQNPGRCPWNHLTPCIAYMEKVLAYGFGNPNGFAKRVTPDNAHRLGWTTATYEESGFPSLQPLSDPALKARLKKTQDELQKSLLDNQSAVTRLTELISHYPDPSKQTHRENNLIVAKSNLRSISEAFQTCAKPETTSVLCRSQMEQALRAQLPIDPSALD